jgi:hypothetical protein
MALFNTVRFPASVLDLGTVKGPLVACLVWYRWVSELSANCLNRQFGTFNTSITRTKTNNDAVNLSSTLSQERLTVWLSVIRAAFFWTSCNLPISFLAAHMTTQLGSSPGASKLGPVGHVWSTEISRRMDRPLHILSTIDSICFDHEACYLGLVSSTCSIATLFNNRESDLSQKLCF